MISALATFGALLWAAAPHLVALSVGEALAALTLFRVADKYALWALYEARHPAAWPHAICRLCVAFWLAQLVGLPVALAQPLALLAPFLAAGLTLALYRQSL